MRPWTSVWIWTLWAACAGLGGGLLARQARAESTDTTLDGRGVKEEKDKDKDKKRKRRRKLKGPPYYSSLGEGQTLPKEVLRLRLPFQKVSSTYGFDGSGHKQDLGVTVNATGTAAVLEYGLTSRLTTQILAPYVMSSNVSLNGNQFAQSSLYANGYGAFVGGVGAKLQAQGICPTPAACRTLIDSGYALPTDTTVTLPSGELLTVKAGVPVKTYANSLVIGAARPLPGATGIGDLELGALYMFFRTYNFDMAAGAGLRLPTGSFANVPSAQVPTGRGTLDLGIRFNVDFMPLLGVWLSFQNQAEQMLVKAKRERTSLLDDSQVNQVDSSQQVFERRGVRNLGFFKVGWGLGDLTQALAALGMQAQYKYHFESEEYLDGVSTGPKASGTSVLGGVILDGLAYRIPAQVEYDYEVPVSGTNETVAQTIQLLTLKAYYKF